MDTKSALVWSVLVILSCDDVCDCEDVDVGWRLVSVDVLLVGFVSVEAEVGVLAGKVPLIESVDLEAVLDGSCVSVAVVVPTVAVILKFQHYLEQKYVSLKCMI